MNPLARREAFGLVVWTLINVNLIGYKWVFARKHNKKNKIDRYKARLVALGFLQRDL